MHHFLRPLFAPESVALVGASERPTSLGRIVFGDLLGGGFTGAIYAVNPRHSRILGQPAFASLDATPEAVDIGIIALPPDSVADVAMQVETPTQAALLLTSTTR